MTQLIIKVIRHAYDHTLPRIFLKLLRQFLNLLQYVMLLRGYQSQECLTVSSHLVFFFCNLCWVILCASNKNTVVEVKANCSTQILNKPSLIYFFRAHYIPDVFVAKKNVSNRWPLRNSVRKQLLKQLFKLIVFRDVFHFIFHIAGIL